MKGHDKETRVGDKMTRPPGPIDEDETTRGEGRNDGGEKTITVSDNLPMSWPAYKVPLAADYYSIGPLCTLLSAWSVMKI